MIQQHTDRSLAFTSAADDLLDRARKILDAYARMARAESACAQALAHQQGVAYPADGNQGGVSEARRAGL